MEVGKANSEGWKTNRLPHTPLAGVDNNIDNMKEPHWRMDVSQVTRLCESDMAEIQNEADSLLTLCG